MLNFVVDADKTCYMTFNMLNADTYPDPYNYTQLWLFNSVSLIEFLMQKKLNIRPDLLSFSADYYRNLAKMLTLHDGHKVNKVASIPRVVTPFLVAHECVPVDETNSALIAPDDFQLIDISSAFKKESATLIQGTVDVSIGEITWQFVLGFAFSVNSVKNEIETYVHKSHSNMAETIGVDYLAEAYVATDMKPLIPIEFFYFHLLNLDNLKA